MSRKKTTPVMRSPDSSSTCSDHGTSPVPFGSGLYWPHAGDPLAAAAEHSGAVVTSALLVLVMGLSLALIPVVLFPLLRRVNEVLAIGYLIVRGAVETACYAVIAIGWLFFKDWRAKYDIDEMPPAAHIIIVMGSLAITQYSAAVQMLPFFGKT